MENIVLNILDCSLQRRLKPIQNISLIIFTVSWVFIFILIFFNTRWASILFYAFIVLSLISAVTAIIISLFFFKKKKIGTAVVNTKKITINNNIYDINDWCFDFNIYSMEEQTTSTQTIEKLPYWGNYITEEKSNLKIEFEPNKNLENIFPHIKIKNTKRPALSMKTTDLFNNLMSLLWAAS